MLGDKESIWCLSITDLGVMWGDIVGGGGGGHPFLSYCRGDLPARAFFLKLETNGDSMGLLFFLRLLRTVGLAAGPEHQRGLGGVYLDLLLAEGVGGGGSVDCGLGGEYLDLVEGGAGASSCGGSSVD